jgi:hypothetical protein
VLGITRFFHFGNQSMFSLNSFQKFTSFGGFFALEPIKEKPLSCSGLGLTCCGL